MAAPWDRRSPAEQQRVQGLAMARWLPSAASFSGHWMAVANELGVDPDVLRRRQDLQRFPTTRERELIVAGGPGAPGLVMRPTSEQVKAIATTETLFGLVGSLRRGGQAALRRRVLEEYKPIHIHRRGPDGIGVAYSRRDLDRLHLAGARTASVLGLDEDDYLVSAIGAGPTLAFWGTYHLGLGASMLALHPRGGGDGLGVVVDAFGLAPTTCVVVEAHEAVELARMLAQADVTVSRVATVVMIGPVPQEEQRELVAEEWRLAGARSDVAVLAAWAPAEGRNLWAEQRENPGSLVTQPDLELVEVVDPLTGMVTDGPGDLTISSIGWTGTALVRYQTGTWVGGLDETPDPVTGRTAPRILADQVEDAWQPTILGAEGDLRIDLRGVAATVAGVSSVRNWIVEIRKPTTRVRHDRVIVDLGGEVSEDDLAAVTRALPDAIGVEPENVRVVSEDQIAARQGEAGSVFVDLR